MELSEIQSLVPDFEKLHSKIVGTKITVASIATYLNQYNPEKHDIMDTGKRPDKIVTVNENNVEVTKSVTVARLSVPLQKKIVALAASFLCGNPIKLSASPAEELQTKLLEVVKRTWTKNKLDYDSKAIAKLMMSETEAAELWYRDAPDSTYWTGTINAGRPHRVRMKILANSLGDTLYPIFNNMGDMVAFGREYKIQVEGKDQYHFDIYTDQTNYLATKNASSWEVNEEKNWFGKIPVIYYYQPNPEWKDVQSLIDRFEKTLSNHSDTNDYFASPMVKVKGTVKGFAAKGESGKVLELENGADAEYMSWDQSPKSQELEFKNLRSLIYDLTDTPDISIEQMKSLGTYSGVALKMLFLAPHLKAAEKEETFGKCIQRRINLIIAAMAKINVSLEKATGLEITPRFDYYLPKNEGEMIDMLVSATGSKQIMTVETAVARNPLVDDASSEIEKLKEETVPEAIEP